MRVKLPVQTPPEDRKSPEAFTVSGTQSLLRAKGEESPTLRVLAIDPGGTSGAALYEEVDGQPVVTLMDFPGADKFDELFQPGTIIVYEKPFLTQHTNPIVFEVKGSILERAKTRNLTVVEQGTYVPKFAWTRYQLAGRIIGSQHKKDAFCHLLFYLTHKQFKEAADIIAAVKRN